MKRLALALLFCLQTAVAADVSIIGTWSNPGGSFTFHSSGAVHIAWLKSHEYVTGTWTISGASLDIETGGNVMHFMVYREDNLLMLTDERGEYVYKSALSPGSKD